MSNGVLRNKKFEIQLSVQKDNPLTPGERRIYSLLVYRQRHDQGTTRRQIAKRCRVSRNCKLNHIASYENGKWYPLDTPKEWWAWKKKNGGHASWRLFTPSGKCPLSESINSIYSLLVSLAGQKGYINNQRVAGLVKLSGYSRRQVFTSLKVLGNHNLIVRTYNHLIVKSPVDLSWWTDRPTKADKAIDRAFNLFERLNIRFPQDPTTEKYLRDGLNSMGIVARQQGLSATDIDIYFRHVINSIKSASRIIEYCMSVGETHLKMIQQAKYNKLAFLTAVFDNWLTNHSWCGV